jgi:hypothetical protein
LKVAYALFGVGQLLLGGAQRIKPIKKYNSGVRVRMIACMTVRTTK